MRQAYNDTEILYNDNTPIGLSFGSDFCAEHEWGISDIKRYLEVDSDLQDFERFRINNTNQVHYFEHKNIKGLILSPYLWYEFHNLNNTKVLDHYFKALEQSDKDLIAFWNNSSFLLLTNSDSKAEDIKDIWKSVQKGCGIIGYKNEAFGGAGLLIYRTDFMEDEWKIIKENFEENLKILQENKVQWAKETEGLYDALMTMNQKVTIGSYPSTPFYYLPLPQANKKWTISEPKFLKENNKLKVWLNPTHQDLFRFGYYTSEDLWNWSIGRGPIWPLLVALPKYPHPIYQYIYNLIPPPDSYSKYEFKSQPEWGSYPWNQSGIYYQGNGFWNTVQKEVGIYKNILYKDGSGNKIPHCHLFNKRLQEAKEKGLTEIFIVSDKRKAQTLFEKIKKDIPNFDYMFYGRGYLDEYF